MKDPRSRRPRTLPTPVPETRAEVARRRLAQLTASFEQSTGAGSARDDLVPPEPPATSSSEAARDLDPAPRPGVVTSAEVRRLTAPVRPPGAAHRASRRRTPSLTSLHVRALMTVGVAAGVLITWWVLAERPRTAELADPVQLSADAPAEPGPSPSGSSAAQGEVVVDVAGKVEKPGIVTLPAGSRVYEAIRAAGGIAGRIEEPTLNMARPLVDGEQLLVGVQAAVPDTPGAAGAVGSGPGGEGTIDLNSATAAELDELPGVGPVTAQAILDWRAENGRFASVEDLLSVSGIGEKTLADLRDRVRV